MKALVTGCAGFIGFTLCSKLLLDGNEVIGIDSMDPYYSINIKENNVKLLLKHPRFRFADTDVSDNPEIPETDVIFHLAGQPGVRASWGEMFERYIRNNILSTQVLLENSRCKRFIYASSSSVYGERKGRLSETAKVNPLSPYGVTKLAAENLCISYHKEFGVPVTALRFFSVYGPGQRPDMAFSKFCKSIIAGEPIKIFGAGDQIRDFTFVDDVVEFICKAAETNASIGEVINIGGGSPVSLNRSIDILERVSGCPIKRIYLNRESGDVSSTWADTKKMERILGAKEMIGIEEGLLREWDHFKRSTSLLANVRA